MKLEKCRKVLDRSRRPAARHGLCFVFRQMAATTQPLPLYLSSVLDQCLHSKEAKKQPAWRESLNKALECLKGEKNEGNLCGCLVKFNGVAYVL